MSPRVQCPAGHRVPKGAAFCPECGLAVEPERCGQCGAPLLAPARFCAACGAPVAAAEDARARSSEELRQVTAVFCDIVGSTELSTRLDPEQYGEVVTAYQATVRSVIDRYGGNIEKYLGDGVLIDFGWPQAHDDDAERAVLAALAIAEDFAADRGVAVRIGIHTGPVLVGQAEAGAGGETIALGETMNLASRLQGRAEPGQIVISEDTLRLVRGIFIVEDLGPQSLDGIPQPVRAFHVMQRSGVRSRFDAVAHRLTPLVNRETDLASLVGAWTSAEEGSGQAVLISGDPGIGKSRLVHELRERLRGTNHTWLEGRGSSYTHHSPFRPVIELLEQALELDPAADEAVRLQRLERAIGQAGLAEADASPLLAGLLGLEHERADRLAMSPELTRRRTIDLLARWLLSFARLQPVLLLIEDLHWCDGSTLDLFEQLMVQGGDSRLLLVGTARPELDVSWLGHPALARIELSPLSDAETSELLMRVSSGRGLPAPVLERVIDEADGVPLFAEEVGQMVLDSGALAEREGELVLAAPLEELEIPTTLHASLTARLDRLSAAKQVAQLAAAIGREFDSDLLVEVSGHDASLVEYGIRRLTEDGLIVRRGSAPSTTYAFKHALIRDAAYQSLLRKARRPLHERIASALEERPGVPAPEVLARHWEGAGHAVEAIEYYRQAAEDAARQCAYSDAIAQLRRALALIGELEEGTEAKELEIELRTALGAAIMGSSGYADAEVKEAYDRARELCVELDETSRVGYTLIGLAIFYFNSGDVVEGARLAAQALGIAETEEDDTLALLARVQLAVPCLWRGSYREALTHAEAAWSIYERERHSGLAFRYGTDQGVAAQCMAGCALANLGRPDEGLERVHAAISLARELDSPFNVVYALALECGVRWHRGELGEQQAVAQDVVEIAEEQGFSDFAGMGRILRGSARAVRDGDAAGLEDCLEGLELAAQTGRRGSATMFMELVGAAQRAAGDPADALAMADAALALADETDQHWWDARLLLLRGELLLELDDGDDSEGVDSLRRGADLAQAQGDTLSEERCRTSLDRALAGRDASRTS
jgi:class 3 adenylate cyclase/tetratricopeptide (TPR) repeat protein